VFNAARRRANANLKKGKEDLRKPGEGNDRTMLARKVAKKSERMSTAFSAFRIGLTGPGIGGSPGDSVVEIETLGILDKYVERE
jgi:hypothetical protein